MASVIAVTFALSLTSALYARASPPTAMMLSTTPVASPSERL
jgi:hypothetical protein